MTRSIPTSSKMTYSRTVTYLAFEKPHGEWIEWEIFTRQVIRLNSNTSGKIHEIVVRHNGHWRELHPSEQLDAFIASNTGKITQFMGLESKVGIKSGTSKKPLPFLLWTDKDLGIYWA
jgi:hypothetical protein